MSKDKARIHLKKYNLEDKIKLFEEETKTVEQAANVLKCEKGQIAKTMSFKLNDKYILVVTSGDTKIDEREGACRHPPLLLTRCSPAASVILGYFAWNHPV